MTDMSAAFLAAMLLMAAAVATFSAVTHRPALAEQTA